MFTAWFTRVRKCHFVRGCKVPLILWISFIKCQKVETDVKSAYTYFSPTASTKIECFSDFVKSNIVKDLFSLYGLYSQSRSCGSTLENCFSQISPHSRTFVRIIYPSKITKGKFPLRLRPTLRKQDIQAKRAYCFGHCFWSHKVALLYDWLKNLASLFSANRK